MPSGFVNRRSGVQSSQPAPFPGCYSHEHTSTKFAAQAANNATVSTMCTCFPEVLKVVAMAKTSSDSRPGVSHEIFCLIQDSFTTHGPAPDSCPHLRVSCL